MVVIAAGQLSNDIQNLHTEWETTDAVSLDRHGLSASAICTSQKRETDQPAGWVSLASVVDARPGDILQIDGVLSTPDSAPQFHIKYQWQDSNGDGIPNNKNPVDGIVLLGVSAPDEPLNPTEFSRTTSDFPSGIAPEGTVAAKFFLWHGVFERTNVPGSIICIDRFRITRVS